MYSISRLVAVSLVGITTASVPVPVFAANPHIVTVSNLNDDGPGSLRHAIQTAESVETIVFGVTGTIGLTSGEIRIRKNVSISGPGTSLLTVSGSGLSRVFKVEDVQGSVSISGLTIADGTDWSGGAGLLINGISVTISNCVFVRNSAGGLITPFGGGGGSGGAILNSGGSVFIADTIFTNNSALVACVANLGGTLVAERSAIVNSSCEFAGALWNENGTANIRSCMIRANNTGSDAGGILNRRESSLTVIDCTITDNHSAHGGSGGIGNSGTLWVERSSILGNSSLFQGGGIANDNYATVIQCTIAGNQCGGYGGGGIFNCGILTATNSTISGNSANNGGGIVTIDITTVPEAIGSVTTTLNNCTVYANTAQVGGGIVNLGSVLYGSVTNVKYVLSNTILAGNTCTLGTGPDGSGTLDSNDYNLIGNSKDLNIVGPTTHCIIGNTFAPINPLLGPLQNNGGSTPTHALILGGPAVDTGDCGGLLIDQRGVARPQGGACDIGAFELQQ